jgi:hypothetical protein
MFVPDGVACPLALLDCRITFVSVGPMTERAERSPYKIRWEWYYEYLMEHVNDFDRIFHVDGFDSFFLGDPFGFAPDLNGLYFQMEDKLLRDSPYNKQWLLACHYDVNRYRLVREIIACSGTLIGGAKPFLHFATLTITHPEWPSCWGKGFDQGDFNYILYAKYLPANGTAYFMGCNSGFLTMMYCSEDSVDFNAKWHLLTPDKTREVAFVHQYNRYETSMSVLSALCS